MVADPSREGADVYARIAAMFEEAEDFVGLDLDDFVGGSIAPVVDDNAPQPRSARTKSGVAAAKASPRGDKGLFPWLQWRVYVASAPWPAKAWHIRMARLRACAHLDPSDTDNATRLLRHFGRDLLVRIQEGGRAPAWVTWNNTHWDGVTGIYGARRLAQQIGDLIKEETRFLEASAAERAWIADGAEAELTPEDERSPAQKLAIKKAEAALDAIGKRKADRRKFGISCKNGSRVSAMMDMAAPHVLIPPEAFNADALKVATPTQTLVWSRERDDECPDPTATRYIVTFEARDGHDRRDLITTMVPFSYDATATCPLWLAFCARFLPDGACRRFFQVAAGLGLLGITEQVLIFHYGEGANGKSVALEVITRVLGALAAGLPAEAIAGEEQGGVKPSPEIARLDGKRFVRVSEIKEGEPLQEAFVKRITGSEAFPARNLFEGYYEFRPLFIAHMTGNGYPKISGTDNGIWRRMRVLKWPVTLALDEQRQFSDVVGELVAEAPGILAWLVEGARIYLEEGLITPPSVINETQAYRDEMDSVGRFVRACVTVTGDQEDTVAGKELYDSYVAWAEASGLRPVSNTRFGRDMAAAKGIMREDKRVRLYRCLRLHDVPRNPSDNSWTGDAPSRGW